jgi:hypothetical protein
MDPRSKADKSRRANLQKRKETVSLIIFRDVPHSVPCIELPHHCQKFLDDPLLLSSPYVVQSGVSPDAFTYFMEIHSGAELHFSPETSDDRMLLARKFAHSSLITHLFPQLDFPRREGNVHELLKELDRSLRGTTIKAEFQSVRDSFADVQRRLSMIEEKFDEKLETILLQLEKMTKLVKPPSQKCPSNQ